LLLIPMLGNGLTNSLHLSEIVNHMD